MTWLRRARIWLLVLAFWTLLTTSYLAAAATEDLPLFVEALDSSGSLQEQRRRYGGGAVYLAARAPRCDFFLYAFDARNSFRAYRTGGPPPTMAALQGVLGEILHSPPPPPGTVIEQAVEATVTLAQRRPQAPSIVFVAVTDGLFTTDGWREAFATLSKDPRAKVAVFGCAPTARPGIVEVLESRFGPRRVLVRGLDELGSGSRALRALVEAGR